MAEFTASNCIWKVDDSRAELRCGLVSGCVDLSHPELGLHEPAISDRSFSGSILAVAPSIVGLQVSKENAVEVPAANLWRVGDSYVRGGDLVATYEPRNDWPYTTQIYWSVMQSDSLEGVLSSLSLFVSMQTHLLETWPRLCVHSRLVADETLRLTDVSHQGSGVETVDEGRHTFQPIGKACCVLRRLTGTNVSYAEVMPASDFRQVLVSRASNGACDTSWELFADFLEKGVIRRARMQAVFLSRQNDIANAAALCQEIDRRPLPLTA
jgi:hypothetical protein